MNKIIIKNLEVFYHVGVPDEERATPQRLLITVEMEHDFSKAARTDDLNHTINYFAVTQKLLKFGEERNWKLIEKLADDVAALVLQDFHARAVCVEIKKFVIPQASYVAVRVEKSPSVS
ncbi:MAG: dihydroneopterin aldolase [Verrucomicrobiota bacterium]